MATWEAFGQVEKTRAEFAIDALETVTGLKFLHVVQGGDVTFQWIDFNTVPGNSGFSGFAYYPSLSSNAGTTPDQVSAIGGDVFLNTSSTHSPNGMIELLIHELGHAIGLEHPFEGENTLVQSLDNVAQTVMSYTDVPNYFADRYGPLDIAALTAIYGRPEDFASHLDSWNWNAPAQELTQTGTTDADIIQGISATDNITGQSGDDSLAGFAGDDFLSAQSGNDYASGGTGHDRIFMGTGDDTADGGDGNDEIGGGDGTDSLSGNDGNDTLYGGAKNDTLIGGQGDDLIWAGTGDDEIVDYSTHDSDDTLGGGAGNDTVFAGAGDDIVYGGKGDAATNADSLSMNDGNDTAYGGNGNDSLFGDDGDDLLFGGAGDDQLSGDAGADSLWGGTGNDNLWGGAGADLFGFVAGSGMDRIGDFDPAMDQLDLSEYGLTLAQITDGTSDLGTALEIALNGQDRILVFGLSESELAGVLLL